MKILLDGKPVVNPASKNEIFVLRRAPGNEHYDFVQDIRFFDTYEGVSYPMPNEGHQSNVVGFVIQFVIYSTWGDKYYCGLNGIELYDGVRGKIILEEQSKYIVHFYLKCTLSFLNHNLFHNWKWLEFNKNDVFSTVIYSCQKKLTDVK